MLTPFRALDLTDDKGFLCGKILGDLGVDVIKVEPPGGDPARSISPFYHDTPDPEKSLFWLAYNANKRSITLNIETRDGREIFERLVQGADFIIESFPPGYLDGLGLGYSVLSKVNARLIMASITPFGQAGPYRDYCADDIVVCAMGGQMYLNGDPDRSPVRISFPQAFLQASAAAATAMLIAHYHAETTGEGQWIDVSAQESMIWATSIEARLFWELNQVLQRRTGPLNLRPSVSLIRRHTWPCQDGFISFLLMGGIRGARTNRALVEWMDSEGIAPPFLKEIEWAKFNVEAVHQDLISNIEEAFSQFFLIHTMEELYAGAVKRGIMLDPATTIRDIVEDPQLAARNFWEDVEHPELGTTITYPRNCIGSSELGSRIQYRAPLIGEHNEDIYWNELGFSREEIEVLEQGGII